MDTGLTRIPALAWETWSLTAPLALMIVIGWYGRDLLEFIRVFTCTVTGLTDDYDTEQARRRI